MKSAIIKLCISLQIVLIDLSEVSIKKKAFEKYTLIALEAICHKKRRWTNRLNIIFTIKFGNKQMFSSTSFNSKDFLTTPMTLNLKKIEILKVNLNYKYGQVILLIFLWWVKLLIE